MTARERYPNLAALAQGYVSGRISEWPNLQREAEVALAELAQSAKDEKALREALDHFLIWFESCPSGYAKQLRMWLRR